MALQAPDAPDQVHFFLKDVSDAPCASRNDGLGAEGLTFAPIPALFLRSDRGKTQGSDVDLSIHLPRLRAQWEAQLRAIADVGHQISTWEEKAPDVSRLQKEMTDSA